PLAQQGEIRGIAFTPDGSTILTGSVDRTARLWDAATHTALGPVFRHEGPIEDVAITPDGKLAITAGGDMAIRVWDLDPGRGRRDLLEVEHNSSLGRVAFTPDGQAFAIGSGDGTVRLWNAATGNPVGPRFPHPSGVASLAISPD